MGIIKGDTRSLDSSSYGFWVYHNKIPIYPMFYLLKGDYM